uniref:Uncharacterized protein n=3 Tax=unclassified bacterial viruses TaxID=12333 RepID=A0AAU6W2S6_9VIRU
MRRKQAQCHTQDYTQQRDMVPLSGWLLVWGISNALNDKCGSYEHIGAYVSMLHKIPKRNRKA